MNSTNIYRVQTSQGNLVVWDSRGEGQPVVFIHGNSACKEVWGKQFASNLAKQYRFIAIDLPGHGESDHPEDKQNTYSYDGYAARIHEVMLSLNLNKPIVVGWSLGAHIALALQKSKKIPLAGILITGSSPVAFNRDGKMDMLRAFHPHPNPRRAELLVKEKLNPSEAVDLVTTSGFDPEKAPFMLKAAFAADGTARSMIIKNRNEGRGCGDYKTLVETVTTPLCIVEGSKDPIIRFSYLEEIVFKNLFGGHFFVIPDAGHAAFWDQPDRFNGILAHFLNHIRKRDLRRPESRDEGMPIAKL